MPTALERFLVEERGVRQDKVDSLIQKSRETGERLDAALVESGLLAEAEMLQYYGGIL